MPRAWGRNPAAAVRDPAPLLPGREGGGEGWAKTCQRRKKPPTPKCRRFCRTMDKSILRRCPARPCKKMVSQRSPVVKAKITPSSGQSSPTRLYGPQRCDKIPTTGAAKPPKRSAAGRASKKSPGARSAKRRPEGPTRPGAGAAGPKARRGGPRGTRRPAHGEDGEHAAAQGRAPASPQTREGRAAKPRGQRAPEKARKRAERPSAGAGGHGPRPGRGEEQAKAQRRGANSPDRGRDSGGGRAAPERPSDAKSGAAGREVRKKRAGTGASTPRSAPARRRAQTFCARHRRAGNRDGCRPSWAAGPGAAHAGASSAPAAPRIGVREHGRALYLI